MKILVIDDADGELFTREPSIKKLGIKIEIAKNLTEAKEKIFLNKDFDAIVLDLKLDTKTVECEGNEILKWILEEQMCLLIIYSGNLGGLDESLLTEYDESKLIFKYNKGEKTPIEIINELLELDNKGITKLVKLKTLQREIKKIFWIHSKEMIDFLKENENAGSLESNLFDKYIGILIESLISKELEDEEEKEISNKLLYIPPRLSNLSTGTIIKYDSKLFYIITPACDVSQKKSRYYHVLECKSEIEYLQFLKKVKNKNVINDETGIPNAEGKKALKKIKDNPKSVPENIYFLPKGIFIDRIIYINFHEIEKIEIEKISEFEIVCHTVPRLTKDIVAKFSNCFSRQGSPDYQLN